ncbi:hypothetical protein DY000_02049869 [Brassica cretica]|uniref:Uncharacterized protein n=1 Tax=Brassica cretica TaxID=69181 RepID=A0ABQ7EU55_BRACR|nr:hypothetical protein DY000_02049869 [Brassica cretica]
MVDLDISRLSGESSGGKGDDTVIVAEETLGPEENAEEAAVPEETAVNEIQKEVAKEVIVARVVVDSEIHKKDGRGETKETEELGETNNLSLVSVGRSPGQLPHINQEVEF